MNIGLLAACHTRQRIVLPWYFDVQVSLLCIESHPGQVQV